MKATYDKNDLGSVLEYMREEYGKRILRDPGQMYGMICDLAPKLKREGKVLRQLSELGMLAELEKAADSRKQKEISRVLMKLRYQLTEDMFINEEKVTFFVDVLETLYGLKTPPPKPTTPMRKSDLLIMCAVFALIIAALLGVLALKSKLNAESVPKPPVSEPEPEVGDIEYTLEDGVLTISGSGKMEDYADFDDMGSISHIRCPWYQDRELIVSVVIKDGVTSIGVGAFVGCAYLTSVIIPDSVTSISEWAFYDCDSLTSIVIPNSVTNIGGWAFYHCNSLTSIVIPHSVTSIEIAAFDWCNNLTEVTIRDGVISIGEYAFQGCDNLKEVYIPDSVTSIGAHAFMGCDNLKSVSIPAHISDKDTKNAFNDKVTLITQRQNNITWTLEDGVLTIAGSGKMEDYAYINGRFGLNIHCPWYHDRELITSVVIEDGITYIGKGAFIDCDYLTSVIVPDRVARIGEWAFATCDNLTSIVIPDSVTNIETCAFDNCINLTSVSVPSHISNEDIEHAFPEWTTVTRRNSGETERGTVSDDDTIPDIWLTGEE